MSATPTEKQYGLLKVLGGGAALVVGTRRQVEPLHRRGWVAGEAPTASKRYWTFVRITPDGLRALARAVEKYGLPDLGPKATTQRIVCAKCGGTRHHYEHVEIDVPESARAA